MLELELVLDWQTIATVVVVGLAAGYIGRQAWRALMQRRGGCGQCAACPSEQAKAEPDEPAPPLMQLGTLKPTERESRS
ncbi:MAG: FeoB-associated Cys-rich membrane protein [Pirellulales bacterium]